MMLVWNDKVIYNEDGWGYRITEGEDEEVVLIYFEDMSDGRKETDLARIRGTEYIRVVGEKLIEKANEMDAAASKPLGDFPLGQSAKSKR